MNDMTENESVGTRSLYEILRELNIKGVEKIKHLDDYEMRLGSILNSLGLTKVSQIGGQYADQLIEKDKKILYSAWNALVNTEIGECYSKLPYG